MIHISTDHYYSGDGSKLHKESDEIKIVNTYAKTKFEAEKIIFSYGTLIRHVMPVANYHNYYTVRYQG